MAAVWDAVVAGRLAEALDSRLAGARAVALAMDRQSSGFALHFRELTLEWSLAPVTAGLDVTAQRDPSGPAHRLPSTVRAVRCQADERVIHFELRRVRGRVREVGLVVELLPGRENLVMTEGETHKVVRWLRPPPKSEGRLTVGQPYRAPEPSERAGASGDLTFEEWSTLIPRESVTQEEVLERLAWTSRFNVGALLDGPPEEAYRFWRTLASSEDTGAWVIHTSKGPVPYPVALPHLRSEPADSILDAFARAGAGARRPDQDPALTRLQKEAKKLEKRIAALERQSGAHSDAQEMRDLGDLLLARLDTVPAGSSEAVLEGFDGAPVTVQLDPSLDPAGNARVFYDRAARAQRAREQLPAKIESARASLAEVNSALLAVRREGAEAEQFEHLVSGSAPSRGRRGAATSLPYRKFTTSGSLEVRVGRNSKRNDELTFRHSSPDDIWLHARHVGGSHVVLRWPHKDAPPGRDLEEAAVLAAFHSKARHAGTVPVDWTRRKYVRKPRGAKSGSVTIEREKTVFVRPDPEIVERLRATDDS